MASEPDDIPSQPRLATGAPESFSQPLQRQADRLLTKYRRAATDRNDGVYQFSASTSNVLLDVEFDTLARLRKGVFKIVLERLKERGIISTMLTETALSWCLPTATNQDSTWRLLLQDPLSAPTYLVDAILKLEPSGPDSVPPNPNATLFYIRSFTIKIIDLRKVLRKLMDDGYDLKGRTFLWLQALDDKDDNTYATLRYCGQTKNKPWDRHVSDIYSTSLSGFFGRFLKTLGQLCSEVLANATVQVVVGASTELPLPAMLLNLYEQALIALFGDGSLNLQAGGKDTMTFNDEDQAAFVSLRTDTVNLLQQYTQPCPSTMVAGITRYASDVRAHVEANPSTRGSKGRLFTDNTEEMIRRQGTPSILSSSSAVLVTLGSDIGELHENQEESFFEARGRAADAAIACYNRFCMWELGFGHFLDEDATKRLVLGNYLPFADTFPWFAKDEKDYPAARALLSQYLGEVRPIAVLTYGDLQFFAMTQPAAKFTFKAYNIEALNYRQGRFVQNILGVPHMVRLTDDPTGDETVIIPCFHPGYQGHTGILKEKVQQLFKMVSAIGWYTITSVIRIHRDNPSSTRSDLCMKLFNEVRSKLSSDDTFGSMFEMAKKEYLIALKAYRQGELVRRNAVDLPKPPKGILARKTDFIRRARTSTINQMGSEGIGGYEVIIQEQTVAGPKGDNVRHSLSWAEEDAAKWTLGPIILPEHVVSAIADDKRFIFFVAGGVDIRDSAGQSVGSRKPVASGNTKVETLPLSSILLSMSENAALPLFLEHWQTMTGNTVDGALGNQSSALQVSSTLNQTDPYYPQAFFDASTTRQALPFSSKSLRANDWNGHLSAVRATLPANPGDLLWLLDRFLTECYPNGGDIDLASGSEHRDSIYLVMAKFCAKAMYQHHPHFQALKAFCKIAEMGATERLIATNALTIAFEVLRTPSSKKRKTLVLKVDGQRKDSTRFVATIGRKLPKDAIAEWEEPDLECDVELLEDYTDDEGGAPSHRKRGRDDADYDEDEAEERGMSKVAKL